MPILMIITIMIAITTRTLAPALPLHMVMHTSTTIRTTH